MNPRYIVFTFGICIYINNFQVSNSITFPDEKINILNICADYVAKENETKSSEFFTLPANLMSSGYTKMNITNVQFRLTSVNLNCKGGTTNIVIDQNKNKTKEIKFTPSGILQLGLDVYKPNEFCIKSLTSNLMHIQICNRTCGKDSICIPKCCDMDQVVNLSNQSRIDCTFSAWKNWKPIIYSSPHSKLSHQDAELLNPSFYIHKPSTFCQLVGPELITLKDITWIESYIEKREPFRILSDGIVVKKFNRYEWKPLEVGHFCIDGAINFPHEYDAEKRSVPYSGLEADTIVIRCYEELEEFSPPPHRLLYGFSMLISAFCLFITIIVTIVVPNNRKSYRLILISYFTSFFFLQKLQAISHLLPHFAREDFENDNPYAKYLCVWIAIFYHFFYLFTFCWLTSINIEIWSAFRVMRPTAESGYKRFYVYILFSLVISVPIIVAALVLENKYNDDLEGEVVVPEYGERSCSLEPVYAMFYYVFLPVGILILCNTILYVMTVYTIWKTKESTKCAVQHSTTKQSDFELVFVFLKLYLIMGIPWVFEVISWAMTRHSPIIPWYWEILDLFVIFQGVAILYIFCLTGETRRALLKKYPRFNHLVNNFPLRFLTRLISEPQSSSKSGQETYLSVVPPIDPMMATSSSDQVKLHANSKNEDQSTLSQQMEANI